MRPGKRDRVRRVFRHKKRRTEMLVIFDERHLRLVLSSYFRYHHETRTHPGAPDWLSIYRMGSLQRRLRNCMIGMRAESSALGASEYVDMKLFLMWRARGMKLETPAVRP